MTSEHRPLRRQRVSLSLPPDLVASARAWQAEQQLPDLSAAMAGLVRRALVVESATSHAATIGPAWWAAYLSEVEGPAA